MTMVDAMLMDTSIETVQEMLAFRAKVEPARKAYAITGGNATTKWLTYADVDQRARTIAARLRAMHASGERVLMAHRDAEEYICGLFGSLYAGCTPVSAYPLERARISVTAKQLDGIAKDSQARLGAGSDSTARLAAEVHGSTQALTALTWLTSADGDPPESFVPDLKPNADGLAYVQYTSGSTGSSKGVCLTHQNILANLKAHREMCQMTAESRIVSWLPLSHDMGLIGPVFHPLYLGSQTVFLSPRVFLLRPVQWLRAISQFGGTVTGAPNFAFDLCVDRITFDELEDINLSSLEHIVNGAEPIRASTLERFIAAFEPVGLRRGAMAPAFGLAECTCMVTSATREGRPATRRFDRTRLRQGEAVHVPLERGESIELVACGIPPVDHEVAIVSAGGERLPDGQVGEIWVRGPSVALGYLGDSLATEQIFQAALDGACESRFLRTGDLGVTHGGELFITGRAKEVVIIKGQNHLPSQIEQSVQASHTALQLNGGAAFSVDQNQEELLVVVQEVKSANAGDLNDLAHAVRGAVAREHGVRVASVVLLEPGGVPRTPTGKIRRTDCRELVLARGLGGVLYADGPFAFVSTGADGRSQGPQQA
jgi:acyl-CoA synthetase (AMP-forming)/AMP-acid ligase II